MRAMHQQFTETLEGLARQNVELHLLLVHGVPGLVVFVARLVSHDRPSAGSGTDIDDGLTLTPSGRR